MTDNQQEAPKIQKMDIIPKSVSQALLAGASSAAASYVIGVPLEYIPRVGVAGIAYSLFRSLQDSRARTTPRKHQSRGRQIPFNTGNGPGKINMEFSTGQGGYLIREGYLEAAKKFIFGKPEPKGTRAIPANVPKPRELDEFKFCSQGMQLSETHIKLFLRDAWKHRANGKGLSERRWVREFNQREMWYKELSPAWYYATMNLIYEAGNCCNFQLVNRQANKWLSLACPPNLALGILKWYESERIKNNELAQRE